MIPRRWKFGYKEPPPTLVVLYHDQPIAELEEAQYGYIFRYLPAFVRMGLAPLPGLPLEKKDQFFYDLPTYFEERVPDKKRPEIRDWMIQNKVSESSKLQLLAGLGSHTITDPFEFRIKSAA
jgi:hypothetical protein